ncbi:hypothetical protein MKF32_18905 [Bacillus vallismortis]|uniref:Uncharacterized protein n=1 Tax=Bacillus vallismortis TaxID=72361 RepID=A0ABY4Y4E9_BACVA|nr:MULTISPECIES: hypothetical protein [Bacillus]USP97522.1 hypothetical protein MKF32_18905 [Bacillus vallismortis]
MYQVIKLERGDWREVIYMSEYAFQKELSDEEREEKSKGFREPLRHWNQRTREITFQASHHSLFCHAGGAGDEDGRYCRSGNLA